MQNNEMKKHHAENVQRINQREEQKRNQAIQIAQENRAMANLKVKQNQQEKIADKLKEDDIMKERREPHRSFLR